MSEPHHTDAVFLTEVWPATHTPMPGAIEQLLAALTTDLGMRVVSPPPCASHAPTPTGEPT